MYRTLKILILLCSFTFLLADETVQPMHSIYFSGQKHFDKAELEDAIGVENKSFFQFWKPDNPRIKDKLLPTLEDSLKSFYRSEGFYDANFSIEETNTTIEVAIFENKPVCVNDINISSDYNLSDFMVFNKGDIFQTKTFIMIKSNITEALLNDGYCSYDLNTKAYVDLDKHIVDLHFNIKKGGICTFGKLTTTGLETIDDEVILSRVRALEGERFSTELIQETSNNLYKLNSFDSVLINVDRKIYNVVPVDIAFKEMEKPYHYEVGVGYDTFVAFNAYMVR